MHAFDGEQLAADVGPGKPGDDADLILGLDLAVAVLGHADVIAEVLGRDAHRLLLRGHQLLDRLAGERRELTLEIAHARLAGVAPDQGQQRIVVDRPLLGVEAVLGDRVRDQMPARDLHLLVLGVAGDADDLHAVHQGRRDVERVRRGDEHDVGEVVVDLEIVVVEGASSARDRAPPAAPRTDRRGNPSPSCRPRRAGRADSSVFALRIDWMILPGIEPI